MNNIQYNRLSELNESGLRHWTFQGETMNESVIGDNAAFVYRLVFPPIGNDESMKYIGMKTIKDDGNWNDYVGSSDFIRKWIEKHKVSLSLIEREVLSLHATEKVARDEEQRQIKAHDANASPHYFNRDGGKTPFEIEAAIDGKLRKFQMNEWVLVQDTEVSSMYSDQYQIGLNLPVGLLVMTISVIGTEGHPDLGKITATLCDFAPKKWWSTDRYLCRIPDSELPSTDCGSDIDKTDDDYFSFATYNHSILKLPSEIINKYSKERYYIGVDCRNDGSSLDDCSGCTVETSVMYYPEGIDVKSHDEILYLNRVNVPGYMYFDPNNYDDDGNPIEGLDTRWVKIK